MARFHFFRSSLRVRLVAVIAAVVAAAGVPLIYFSYEDAYERSVASAQQHFDTAAELIGEGLELSYLNSQTLVAEKVALERRFIREMMDVLDGYAARGEKEKLQSALVWENRPGTWATVIEKTGKFLSNSPVITDIYEKNQPDFLGNTLKDYRRMVLVDRYSQDFFSFIRADTPKQRMSPLLVAGRRLADDAFLVVAEELDYLEDSQKERLAAVESHLKEVIQSLTVPEGTSIAVFSGSERLVIGRGVPVGKKSFPLFEKRYSEARAHQKTAGKRMTNGGTVLYALQYFRPFDWYIEITAPQTMVTAPAKIYAAKLTGIVLAVFFLLTALGLASVTRVLKPLRSIAESADHLGRINFASEEARTLTGVLSRLPAGRPDEVGRVADAFIRMVHALEKNIEELKASLAREHNMQGEFNAAREIQEGMLTGHDRLQRENFSAQALMQAAKDVGGDLYDIVELPHGKVALVVGDVSGKGVPAAMLMCVTLTLIRQNLADGLSPAAVMKKVNDQLARNNPNCMFVTLWIGILDPVSAQLVFANGGHCPPVTISSSGEIRWIREVSGPLVGVLEEALYSEYSMTLTAGDVMLVYSDGVTEAMDPEKTLFGEAGLSQALASSEIHNPQTILYDVKRAVTLHRGYALQSDDITMLAFEILPEASV